MNLTSPDKVASIIQILKDADVQTGRAQNRALLVGLFNGDAPYTADEEKENNIQINVNWKEATMLLLQAREQYENAFLTTGNRFGIRLPDAPPSKQQEYAGALTRRANAVLNSSRAYLHTQRSKFGSVCLHGRGPQMWEDQYSPIPFFIGVEDLLIPTDTEITLDNLTHFAVRRRMTPGQLFRKTLGLPKGRVDPGWNLDAVKKILDQMKELNQNPSNLNWSEHPEKLAELWKQNSLYYDSDSVPSVWFWDFYHQKEDEGKRCWYRKIILDNDCSPGRVSDANSPIVFVYQSETPFADTLDQVLHIQVGDGNNKPPFLYHSVRGLGHLLYDVCHMQNRLRCQFLQKVFEDLLLLFRAKDPTDRSRLEKIYLGLNYGIMPEGLDFVKNDERYQVDKQLVEMALDSNKQLMGEAAASYRQDVDTSENKEMTAREFTGRMAAVTKLTASMLNLAYLQETYSYQEICRRLCIKNSPDFTARKFQQDCLNDGVPEKWLNSDLWEIEPERVLGSGNSQLEQFQAQSLMSIRPILNPEAQQRVTHEYVFALTHDPKRAEYLAPLSGAPHITDTVHDTELVFGVLMGGRWVTPKPGLNPIEVVETMLAQMTAEVQRIQQSGGMGNPQQVQGLAACAKYLSAFMQMLAQDKTAKQRVKQYGDRLGQIMNLVKAFAQRQQEAMAKQRQGNGGMDPETAAKIQSDMALTKTKIATKNALERQKMAHKEIAFQADQRRKTAQTMSDLHQKGMHAAIDGMNKLASANQPETE